MPLHTYWNDLTEQCCPGEKFDRFQLTPPSMQNTIAHLLEVKTVPTQQSPNLVSGPDLAVATAKPCGYTVSLNLGLFANSDWKIDDIMKLIQLTIEKYSPYSPLSWASSSGSVPASAELSLRMSAAMTKEAVGLGSDYFSHSSTVQFWEHRTWQSMSFIVAKLSHPLVLLDMEATMRERLDPKRCKAEEETPSALL